jgi:hypothetical protein
MRSPAKKVWRTCGKFADKVAGAGCACADCEAAPRQKFRSRVALSLFHAPGTEKRQLQVVK